MKLLKLSIIALLAAVPLLNSCSDDDNNEDTWKQWKIDNEEWLDELANKRNPDGTPYFTRRTAPWDQNSYVLIHYFGERNDSQLRPLYTSTVDVRYKVHTLDGVGIDSSTLITDPVPGALRVQLNSQSLITGWPIAVTDMHVGDSCEVIIPYAMAYGVSGYGNVPPYSNLRFNLRLVDIPFYEAKP